MKRFGSRLWRSNGEVLSRGKQPDPLGLEGLEAALVKLERSTGSGNPEDYAFLLRQCGNLQSLGHANRLRAIIERDFLVSDRYLCNLAVEMYGKCQDPASAAAVFRNIADPNVFSWTMLMLAFGQNGMERHGLGMLKLMDLNGVLPSRVTFVAALSMCSRLGCYGHARAIHSCLEGSGLEDDTFVKTATMSMYASCQRLPDAKIVFDDIQDKCLVTWNAMISAYTKHGCAEEALDLFRQMELDGVKQNDVTFICLLEAWMQLGVLAEIQKLEKRVYELGYGSYKTLQTAILSFYGRHGCLDDARRVFDALPVKNNVAWNAIIGLYSQHGLSREALKLYQAMKTSTDSVKADEITFVVVLDACSSLGKLPIGKMVHKDIVDHGLEADPILSNALLNMYGKCGSLDAAKQVFLDMDSRTPAAWNSMMTQYAQHGQGHLALDMFLEMQLEGVTMDDITFTTVLSLCSHMGLLREGRDLFFAIKGDYEMVYKVEHYGCMVDLLGRAGMLGYAEELLDIMPFKASPVSWTSFLNSCRLHGNVEKGRLAAKRSLEIEPEESDSTMAILEQIYLNAGRANELQAVKEEMEEVVKQALCMQDGKRAAAAVIKKKRKPLKPKVSF